MRVKRQRGYTGFHNWCGQCPGHNRVHVSWPAVDLRSRWRGHIQRRSVLRHQAEYALKRKRANEPECHHDPKCIGNNLRRSLQGQPGEDYEKDHITCRQAHIQNGKEQFLQHRQSSLWASISFFSSAACLSFSFSPPIKAARNFGNDPPKASSTNRLLCLA